MEYHFPTVFKVGLACAQMLVSREGLYQDVMVYSTVKYVVFFATTC